ncbi:Hypothetical protein PHPALM_12173 [Phytophthora palmivora]|uniref:Uncharacterized protein n=1 Tax=Phytophthora palmivora TaxID=4796 RepID=A0A2P4Y0E8_9STRA|nr:Hypothetical protein PHPALM_12173 [Phytophthora palmivora]
MVGRLGYDVNVHGATQDPSTKIPRGLFSLLLSVTVPSIDFYWWGRKPVHCMCMCSVMTPPTVNRSVKVSRPTTMVSKGSERLSCVDGRSGHKRLTPPENVLDTDLTKVTRFCWSGILLLLPEAGNTDKNAIITPSSSLMVARPSLGFRNDANVLAIDRKKSFKITFYCENCSIDDPKSYL